MANENQGSRPGQPETIESAFQAWIRYEPVLPRLRAISEPRGPVVDVLIEMSNVINENVAAERPLEDILAEAAAAPLKTVSHNFAIYFLCIWSRAAAHCDRVGEAWAVLNRAKSMITESTPPELSSTILNFEGTLLGVAGDKAAREERLNRALAVLAPESKRRWIIVYNRALLLTGLGRGHEVEEDVAWLSSIDGPTTKTDVNILRFIDSTETGRIEEAVSLRKQMADDSLGALRQETLKNDLFATLIHDFPALPDRPADELNVPGLWECVISTWHLLRRQPGEAMDWMRRGMRKDGEIHLHLSPFSYTPIRAELAVGNGEAAQRLLTHRWRTGYRHYLDDFFLARVELLAGNERAAERHFAAVREACRRYRAEPRLEIELRMSCEMTPDSVLRLASAKVAATMPQDAVSVREKGPKPLLALRNSARMIGRSPAILKIRGMIHKFSDINVPVLITGETGTGKDIAARLLHEIGPRQEAPLVAVNCSAIAESLLESELFGHEKGAFTGAERAHKGLFEEAGEGTILLDEIGDISQRLQAALLRVLETGEIRPVGSAKTRRIACRIVAVTNRNIEEMATEGCFRKDLGYRLRRLSVHIPPLRERREDILPLVNHFLAEGRESPERPVLAPELRKALEAYAWPGNVRELRNTVERMRLLHSDKLTYALDDLEDIAGDASRVPRGLMLTGSFEQPEDHRLSLERKAVYAPENADEYLRMRPSALRRLDRVRELFHRYKKLTRPEIADMLHVSRNTVTAYLKVLQGEGLIEKVRPTASPRTHYFVLRELPQGGREGSGDEEPSPSR